MNSAQMALLCVGSSAVAKENLNVAHGYESDAKVAYGTARRSKISLTVIVN